MRKTTVRGAAVALSLTLVPVFSAAAGEGESSPKWGPSVDFEGKAGNKRKIGEADFFLPLAQDDRTLLFGNARLRADTNDAKEGNLGLGLRRMLDDGWNLGGYGYFDRRSSENDSLFNQITLGAEALGRDFDLRANTYWPIGDRFRQLSGSSSGGTGAVELSGTTVVFRSSSGGGSEERALRGFDAEIGWRVPVFDAEGPFDFRVYGGGYRFDDSKVEAIAGPRLRAEFTAYEVPQLWQGARVTVGAEWQHDDVRGSQEFVSLRLRIPLQPEAPRSRALTKQEQRMTQAVVRDVDIVTKVNSTGGSSAPEEIATTSTGQTLRVLTTSNTTNADLPTAVSNVGANSTVMISGTFNPTATTTLASNQTLTGSGSIAVKTASGRTGTFTTAAGTISRTGNNIGNTINMAAGSTVSGFTLSYTDTGIGSRVIYSQDVNNVTISNNTITISKSASTAGAIAISVQNATNLIVTGNTINATATGAGAAAIGLDVSQGSAKISGNTFNSNSSLSTSTTTSLQGVTITAGSTGNVITNGTCANNGGNTGSVSFTSGATCP